MCPNNLATIGSRVGLIGTPSFPPSRGAEPCTLLTHAFAIALVLFATLVVVYDG